MAGTGKPMIISTSMAGAHEIREATDAARNGGCKELAIGVSIIEKHFTLDRNGGGSDDSFSLEPRGMAVLCWNSKTVCSRKN